MDELLLAASQNGWPAGTPAQIGGLNTDPVPGTTVRLPQGVRRGDAATVLRYVAEQFDSNVEPLQPGECWGYCYKHIEGSAVLSNHASGTAIDLNAERHPTGRHGTFTTRQVTAIRTILSWCEGVVRWGGDYRSRKDEMHFEIVRSAAEVAGIARKIRDAQTPKPAPPTGKTWCKGAWRPVLRRGSKGKDVRFLQRMIGGTAADGTFGPRTEARVRAYQRMRGIGVDGVVGRRTWGEINKM
ncbi:M15 family metallopeptidase [Krasilnikovia sp. MM14-A1004]|uniref:M15 family metallopeptidase n=1 Tax=Krasilnikovia sp. MM14-A1004 TaxID=3373541 RepID=UPI00399D3D80